MENLTSRHWSASARCSCMSFSNVCFAFCCAFTIVLTLTLYDDVLSSDWRTRWGPASVWWLVPETVLELDVSIFRVGVPESSFCRWDFLEQHSLAVWRARLRECEMSFSNKRPLCCLLDKAIVFADGGYSPTFSAQVPVGCWSVFSNLSSVSWTSCCSWTRSCAVTIQSLRRSRQFVAHENNNYVRFVSLENVLFLLCFLACVFYNPFGPSGTCEAQMWRASQPSQPWVDVKFSCSEFWLLCVSMETTGGATETCASRVHVRFVYVKLLHVCILGGFLSLSLYFFKCLFLLCVGD